MSAPSLPVRIAIATTVGIVLLSTALVDRPPSPWMRLDRAGRDAVARCLEPAGAEAISLRLYRTPAGEAADFRVMIDGIEVRSVRVRMEQTRSGSWAASPLPSLPAGMQARPLRFEPLARATAQADTSGGLRGRPSSTREWFRQDRTWIDGVVVRLPLRRYAGEALPWSGEVPAAGEAADLELRFDAEGRLIEARDRLLHLGRTGRGLVFDPNPIVASGRSDLRNGDPVDRWQIEVDLEELDASGRLWGRRVRVETGETTTAREEQLRFAFPSDDPRFEEVMAYYHIDRARAWIEELGYGDLFDEAQRVTVHATPLDNSWYSPLTGRIEFGDGGVDDPEDADIILHEFAHALHDAFVPGFGDGETRAISEGFADYLAATRTGDPCIGDWDATSYSPPCLRRTDGTLRYPDDWTGRSHADGQIWSGTLWAIRAQLGEALADRIVLEGLLRQSPSSSMPEAAEALLEAAGALGLDAAIPELRGILSERGLLERRGALRLTAGTQAEVPLDRIWPGAPDARVLLFHADGSVAVGTQLLLLPLRGETASLLSISYRAGADGFSWEWAAGSANPQASGRVLLAEDGSLDLVWLSDPAGWPEGEVGIVAAGEPVVELRAEEVFASGELPPSFTFPVGPEDRSIAGARLLLARNPRGWSVEEQLRPAWTGGRLRVTPLGNPSRGATAIRLDLPEGGPTTLSVFDATGRRVRRLLSRIDLPAGPHQIPWDGRDEAGRRLARGVYWLRLECQGRQASAAIVRITN